MVLVTPIDGDVFDMDPAWLPMFYSKNPLLIRIPTQAAAEELLKYLREEEKKNRMFNKIRRSARLDAFSTGLPFMIRQARVGEEEQIGDPGPRSEIDIAMENDFATGFKDYGLMYDVARGARQLHMTTLYEAIVEHEANRLYAKGFFESVEDAKGYLSLETFTYP